MTLTRIFGRTDHTWRTTYLTFAMIALVLGCSDDQWRTKYAAPYNTAATERRALIWQRSDEAFQDRTDWANEPDVPESQRVYPKPITMPRPVLPDSLAAERGEVAVGYIIERDGRVRDVRVLLSTNPRLDSACVAGVRSWQFTPGTAAGKPSLWRYETTCIF